MSIGPEWCPFKNIGAIDLDCTSYRDLSSNYTQIIRAIAGCPFTEMLYFALLSFMPSMELSLSTA